MEFKFSCHLFKDSVISLDCVVSIGRITDEQ
jgi:hypothetical protein